MSLPPPTATGTALVTGTSSGIGAALAAELATRGHHVTLVARRADRLTALAERIERAGGSAFVLPADLSDPEQRIEVLEKATASGRTVDMLVNAAGITVMGPVADGDPEAQAKVAHVDAIAVADLCARVVPSMVQRGRGAILNVASTAAFQPLPGQAIYSAAKAFVLTYSQALGAELRGTGVTVSTLCPGPVATEIAVKAGMTMAEFEASMPRAMWSSAESVASSALDGLDKGKTVVVPGILNRAAAQFGRLAPRALLMPLIAANNPALHQ